MTGRRLYELVTSELSKTARHQHSWADTKHHTSAIKLTGLEFGPEGKLGEVPIQPPAFDFLPEYERNAWNAAARRASGRR